VPLALLTHDALLSSHGACREITDNQHDEYYRYKAPLPEDAQDGDTVDIQLSDAKAFTKKDFMIELEDDLEHHKGNMADYRAILLILLFFGPFYLITAQSVMFAQDLGVRGPDAVQQGDLFKLHNIKAFALGRESPSALPEYLKGRYWQGADGTISASQRGAAVSFDTLRGRNPERNMWETEIARAWKDGDRPDTIWDGAYKGDVRSESQKVTSDCQGLLLGAPFPTQVTPMDRSGAPLPSSTFTSEASMQGTYCVESFFFVVLLFIVPFVLIAGFFHMTFGWRADLRNYVMHALTREMSDAAKAVQIEDATKGDRFGGKYRWLCCAVTLSPNRIFTPPDLTAPVCPTVRAVGSTEGSRGGMVGENNAYHAGWLKRDRKIGDMDGDGEIDTVSGA